MFQLQIQLHQKPKTIFPRDSRWCVFLYSSQRYARCWRSFDLVKDDIDHSRSRSRREKERFRLREILPGKRIFSEQMLNTIYGKHMPHMYVRIVSLKVCLVFGQIMIMYHPTTRIPNSSSSVLCHEKAVLLLFKPEHYPPAGTERVMIRIFIRIN